MRSTLLLIPTFLVLLGCDGRYTLGDLRPKSDDDDAGGSSGGEQASGSPGTHEGGSPMGMGGGSGASGSSSVGILVSPSTLPSARLSRPYVATFDAIGGAGQYTFQLLSGALPAGLSLDQDGTLTGTPEEAGEFTFAIEATDTLSSSGSISVSLGVSRSRWLASATFPSSASTQSLLSFFDLDQPAAEPVRIENQSANSAKFSGDGRWLLYNSPRSATEIHVYAVNTAGKAVGPKELAVNGNNGSQCVWAPDFRKLVCVRELGPDASASQALAYFDMSHDSLGTELPLGAGGGGPPVFLDPDTLVYRDEAGNFTQVGWNGATPGAPQPLGMGGGTIRQQALDGERALVERAPPIDEAPAEMALVNFRTGETKPLAAHEYYSFSQTLEVAIAYDPPPAGDTGLGTYFYYSVNGVGTTLAGQEPVGELFPPSAPIYQLAGKRVGLIRANRAVLLTIDQAGVLEQVVAGDLEGVQQVELDPGGSWLYIRTAELDAQNQPIASSTRHWLSHLDVNGPAPAQLIDQGFSASSVGFSPNSRRMVLHGYAAQSPVPTEFRLFDLADPEQVQGYDLVIPLNWSNPVWSPDSSYVHFIGGAPVTNSRPLLVVDALAPNKPPRLMVECNTNPAPLPGCPNAAAFQP